MKIFPKTLLFCLLTFLFWGIRTSPSLAICTYPDPRIRTLFTRADTVFIGTVVSRRGLDESGKEVKNDADLKPLGEASEVYFRCKTVQVFKGSKNKFIEVCEDNDSGRMGLMVGQTYLILIEKNENGKLKGGCGDDFNSANKDYKRKISEVNEVIKNIKKGEAGDILGFVRVEENMNGGPGLAGIHFLVTGSGISKEVTSDKDGWFHVRVPQGHYKIEGEDSRWNIEACPDTSDSPDDVDVRTAGGGEVDFLAERKP